MELTTIRELFKNREAYLDKEVTVGGWIRSIRDSKTFGFIVLNDGSYFDTLQIVYHDKMENFAEVSKLNVGAAIIVKGTLVATPQAKQPFEIQAEEVVIEGASARIIHCRRSVTALSILEQFLIFVREQTHSRLYSEFVLWQHMRFTSSSRTEDLYMYTLR